MFSDSFCEDQNIVEVHTYDTFSNQILEDVIHHCLEGRWGVAQSEKHHQGFKESSICMKGHLPFIAVFHTHIIVSPSNIKFCEVLGSSKLVYKVQNQW